MSQRYLNWGEFPVKQDQCSIAYIFHRHILDFSRAFSSASEQSGWGDLSVAISALESYSYVGDRNYD